MPNCAVYLKENWKNHLLDGRFWIVFFAILRLYAITDPPLEVVHNWRQSSVAMVARNFYESSPDILYPKLDIDGSGTGIEGMEFPVLNYCIYLVAEVFGYNHWYGRLINLIVSSMGIWCLFLMLKRYAGERMALMAVIILEVSMWFVYMRKMMPDTFSVAIVLCGIYFAVGYLLEKKNAFWLVASVVLISLGTLSKIPASCLLPALLLPLVKASNSRRILFVLGSIVAMIPVIWWYFIWVPYLNTHFGTGHFFMGQSFTEGLKSIAESPGILLYYFASSALKFIGFAVMILGIVMSFLRKKFIWLYASILCFIPFVLLLVKGGYNSLHHDYYFVPFVPVMAVLAAFALTEIKNARLAYLLLFAIVLEGILNQYTDFRIKDGERELLSLESRLDTISNREDIIAINSPFVPTPMYFAHRKGWLCSAEELGRQSFVEELNTRGLDFIVVLKNAYEGDMQLPYTQVYEDDAIRVYNP